MLRHPPLHPPQRPGWVPYAVTTLACALLAFGGYLVLQGRAAHNGQLVQPGLEAHLQSREDCACTAVPCSNQDPILEHGASVSVSESNPNNSKKPETQHQSELTPELDDSPNDEKPAPPPTMSKVEERYWLTHENHDHVNVKFPSVPLLMGRTLEVVPAAQKFFAVPGLFLEAAPKLGKAWLTASQEECAQRCANRTQCHAWVFRSTVGGHGSNCELHPNSINEGMWRVGFPLEVTSGNVMRHVMLWTNPSCSQPRNNRTLLVVNWHWPTSKELMLRYHVAHGASLPVCTDVVHASSNMGLPNVWTMQGKLSYLSIAMAHVALPGYRGYFQTNDDAFVLWHNIPLRDFPEMFWIGTEKTESVHYNPFYSYNSNTSAKAHWKWFRHTLPAYASRRAAVSPRNDFRAFAAVKFQQAVDQGTGKPNITSLESSSFIGTFLFVCQSDTFYIPGRLMQKSYRAWLVNMASFGVFLEIAVPTAMHFVEASSVRGFLVATKWRQTTKQLPPPDYNEQPRQYAFTYFDPQAGSIHPVKLSDEVLYLWLVNEVHGFDFT